MTFDLARIPWQKFPLFQNVDESIVRHFLSSGFEFDYPAGSLLISHDDKGETFFLITQGLAKLVLSESDGKAYNLILFHTGDFFGELSMLEPNIPRNGNIEALQDVTVIAIQKREFLKLLMQYPILSLNLARVLGRRLRKMNEFILNKNTQSPLEKISHTLKRMLDYGLPTDKPNHIVLPALSLKEWALFCETDSPELIEAMETLKEQGILEWRNQRIVVNEPEKLKTYGN